MAVNLTKASQNCISCWWGPLDVHSVKQKNALLTHRKHVCLKMSIKKPLYRYLASHRIFLARGRNCLLTYYTKVFPFDNIKHQIRLFIWAKVRITALIMRNVLLHYLKQLLLAQMEKKLYSVFHIQGILKHFTTQELTVYWLHREMWQPLYPQRMTYNLIGVRKGLLANMLIIWVTGKKPKWILYYINWKPELPEVHLVWK